MKESIGLTFTINIMIVFLFVAFTFILATLSYSKAYRASSAIINALEKYEGYNELSKAEINDKLMTLGYMDGNSSKCPKTRENGKGQLVTINNSEKKEYCIYLFDNDGDKRHYSYGVVTYITFDFNVFNFKFKLPIYNRVRRIFRFNVNRA